MSEPKHTAVKGFQAEAAMSLQNVSSYLQSKEAMDNARLDALKVKLELDRAKETCAAKEFELRTQQEEENRHLNMAKLVLGIKNADAAVHRAANEYLIGLFKPGL